MSLRLVYPDDKPVREPVTWRDWLILATALAATGAFWFLVSVLCSGAAS